MDSTVHVGLAFPTGRGLGRVVGVTTVSGAAAFVVEDDGEQVLVPHNEFLAARLEQLAAAQASAGPCVRWEDSTSERVKFWLPHLLEVIHGDPDGSVHAPRPGVEKRRAYDPILVPSMRRRVAEKSRELTSSGVRGASIANIYKLVKRLQNEGPGGIARVPSTRTRDPENLTDLQAVAQSLCARQATRSDVPFKHLRIRYLALLQESGVSIEGISKARLNRILSDARHKHRLQKPARVRKSQAGRPPYVQGSSRPSRPGEVIEIDVTDLNFFCWSPSGWIPAEILTALDVFDRAVLALRVVPKSHSSRDLRLLLFDAMSPVIRRANWTSGDERPWRGAPGAVLVGSDQQPSIRGRSITSITVDHGAAFESRDFLNAAAWNGIDVMFAGPGRGHQKPHVESLHRLYANWTSILPGARGSHPGARGDDVEAEAFYTIDEAEQLLYELVSSVYHPGKHEGLPDPARPGRFLSPQAKFEHYLANGPHFELPLHPNRVFDFLDHAERRADTEGITLNTFRYDDDNLTGLRDHERPQSAPPLQVRYDRYDTSRIYVEHPDTGRYLEVRERTVALGGAVALDGARMGRHRRDAGAVLSPAEIEQRQVELSRRWGGSEWIAQRAKRSAVGEERYRLAQRDRSALGIAAASSKLTEDNAVPPGIPEPDTELKDWSSDIDEGVFG